jgi:hypothetical protein
MTRENLKNISNCVKNSFARLLSFNGYSKETLDDHPINMELVESFCNIVGEDFKFGAAYENIRVLEKGNEEGIATIESSGLSFRSFINLSDGLVFKSVYVRPGECKDESYMSARFFSEDQSLFIVNAKTKGKRNKITELCLSIYDSKEVRNCFDTIQNFNPCEIGENINEHIHPSRILILLSSTSLINGDLCKNCLSDYETLSKILILNAS